MLIDTEFYNLRWRRSDSWESTFLYSKSDAANEVAFRDYSAKKRISVAKEKSINNFHNK